MRSHYDLTVLAKLLNTNTRIYLACTGAGAGIQDALWRVPGCSAFFVGAEFPYDPSATERFLGFRPEQFCSVETAVDLAMESYSRACTEDGRVTAAQPIGLGLTASVASLHAHRGEHRVCAALMTRRGVWAVSGVLEKGVGLDARAADGDLADCVGLGLLLHGLGLGPEDELGVDQDAYPAGYNALLPGVGPVFVANVTEQARGQFLARGFHTADGRRLAATPENLGDRHLFSGAFDPPHAGHFGIADGVAQSTGTSVAFAVTASAPHKPPVPLAELVERAALLRGRDRMFTEGDPLYLDKARRYPNRAIVLGVDALQRLLDPKWGLAIVPMLREFAQLGTTFFVFGRFVEGRWLALCDVLGDLDLPSVGILSPMSQSVAGRWDISSSELRAARTTTPP